MRFFKFNLIYVLVLLAYINVVGQDNQFVNKVFEYHPAPGQFINTTFGSPDAAKSIVGSLQGGVSLGAYGGYIVLGFKNSIENDIANPYGIDFTVFGNANQSSSEAGIVYVMKDENKNGLPDDTWYVIAGSDYWFSTTTSDFEITYVNPNDTLALDVFWEDNMGNTGLIPANEFHKQPYYPLRDSFPNVPADQDTFAGILVKDRLDKSNPAFIVSSKYPFGFVDNQVRAMSYSGWEPDNPYTSEIEGAGGDGMDISWAVNANGDYVAIDKIDFIKIQTGVNALAGWLGELSTEVLGIVDVAPDNTLLGETKLTAIEPIDAKMLKGDTRQLNAFHFELGRIQNHESTTWLSSNTEIASVNSSGVLETHMAGECMIYAQWDLHPDIKDSLLVKVENATSVNAIVSEDVYVYPNPANHTVFVNGTYSFSSYRIYNALGTLLWQSELIEGRIDIENLSKGFYIVELQGTIGSICKTILKN